MLTKAFHYEVLFVTIYLYQAKIDLGQGLRTCISDKFPGVADAVGLGATLVNHRDVE